MKSKYDLPIRALHLSKSLERKLKDSKITTISVLFYAFPSLPREFRLIRLILKNMSDADIYDLRFKAQHYFTSKKLNEKKYQKVYMKKDNDKPKIIYIEK